MPEQPEASLYTSGAVTAAEGSTPFPGTLRTASIETIDNDRAGLMLDAGVVR